MDRKGFFDFVEGEYGILPDYPFEGDGDTAVFRHYVNRKWFALVTRVPRSRLGLEGDGSIDIVNLKCSPALTGSIRSEAGFYPAWHMNKSHWLSAALDGSADDETLKFLINVSFDLTKPKMKKARS